MSPYRRVATLEIPRQESFSPARRVYAERVMSYRPDNREVAELGVPTGDDRGVIRREHGSS